MNPFLWFLLVVVVIVAGLGYAFRNAFDSIRDAAVAHARIYAKPYAICSALILIAGMTTYHEVFSKLTAEEIAAMTQYQWVAKFFLPAISMLNVLVAFLNTSKSEADANVTRAAAIRRETSTLFAKTP